MDKNAVILLSGASLLRREAGGMLQVQAVPARVDKVISAMKPPAFRPGKFWGDIFTLTIFFFFFACCICISEKGRKRKFNSNRTQ